MKSSTYHSSLCKSRLNSSHWQIEQADKCSLASQNFPLTLPVLRLASTFLTTQLWALALQQHSDFPHPNVLPLTPSTPSPKGQGAPTSASGGWAAASWPCTVCPPASGSVETLASDGSHNNDIWSFPCKYQRWNCSVPAGQWEQHHSPAIYSWACFDNTHTSYSAHLFAAKRCFNGWTNECRHPYEI